MFTLSENCSRHDTCVHGGQGLVHIKDLADQAALYDHSRLFAHITLDPGCSIGPHVHEHETEFFYILRGEGVFDDDGTEVVVRPGDVCATGGGHRHGMVNRGTEPVEFIALIAME